ncbi:MAG: hypothetical protein HYZ39_14285 [Mycolicibacterium cosmeticum]|nr:hypothetical protein [Mycolicibacterium cosmeticum]
MRQWWRQPDRYPWLVGYLETHGVQTWARIMMCLPLVAGGLTPVLVLASAAGPQGTPGRVLSVAAGAVGMSTVLLWLRPGWPSPKQSVLFALVVIDALSAEPDAAMYEAKRAGGNQFRVRVNPPLP